MDCWFSARRFPWRHGTVAIRTAVIPVTSAHAQCETTSGVGFALFIPIVRVNQCVSGWPTGCFLGSGLLNMYLSNGPALHRRTDKGRRSPPVITVPLHSSAPQTCSKSMLSGRAPYGPAPPPHTHTLFLSCLTPLRWKEQAYHDN